MIRKHILVDGREFTAGRQTGIGRFVEGLVDGLVESDMFLAVSIACHSDDVIPEKLKNRTELNSIFLPDSFLKSEKVLSDYSRRGINLFISPYRKLPIFGVHCPSVHTIHDVFDLAYLAYSKRLKVIIDRYRLKKDLSKADLTWYDSAFSMEETKKIAGFTGKDARVRHLGIDKKFGHVIKRDEDAVLRKYNLLPGYILMVGNGLPHKNIGVLLTISKKINRQLVFVGVSQTNQDHWKAQYSYAAAVWISHIVDSDLPAIINKAFCVAQPSTAEGYGYPPLEAMACGVPAVVSNIPVLLETTGGYALTADPNSPESWLERFNALENRVFRQNRIKSGLQWANNFRGSRGWQKHIADIEELILRN